jgi:hypothetical protein
MKRVARLKVCSMTVGAEVRRVELGSRNPTKTNLLC